MADSNIRISLELADAAAQKALTDFISKAGQADTSFKKLNDSGKSTFSEIGVSIGKATGLYEIFAGNIAANLATEAINFIGEAAHKLFDTFIIEGVKAAEETQNAINSLNVALASSGHYSKETSDSFIEFADQLQKTTIFSHDAIITNAALIESLGQLDEDGLKRATKAALDLASATGKDLPSASELVAKAANGNITALNKMGLSLQVGRDHAETFANALTAIEEHFGGTSESKVNTYSGAVTQAGNSFKDLTEQIGNLIVMNPVFIESLKELSSIFEDISDSMKNQHEALGIVGIAFVTFTTVISDTIVIMDYLVRSLQTVYGAALLLTVPLAALMFPIIALKDGVKAATAEFDVFITHAANNFTALGKSGDGALKAMSADLDRIGDAASLGLAKLSSGADGTVAPIKNSTSQVVELTEEMKRAQARALAFAESLIKASEDGKTSTTSHLAIVKANADAENSINEDLVARKIITQSEFERRKADLDRQFATEQTKANIQQLAQENDLVDKAFADRKITEKEYYTAKKQLMDQFNSVQDKNAKEDIARNAKTSKAIFVAEKAEQTAKIQAVADTFTALSALTQTKSRELFEIGKQASAAAALINTYQAITKTMASVPYPFNIPLAIAQGIAGAVQVANIEATNPSFESGGIVPGSSFSGDNVTANVNSGEMILNRAQQKKLFDIAQGGGGSNIDYGRLASAVAQAMGTQPIHVQVGGKTIVDTLRGELVSGRRFA